MIAGVKVVPVIAAVVGRAGWVVPRPLGRAVNAFAPTAGSGSCTWQVSRATRSGVQSAVHR